MAFLVFLDWRFLQSSAHADADASGIRVPLVAIGGPVHMVVRASKLQTKQKTPNASLGDHHCPLTSCRKWEPLIKYDLLYARLLAIFTIGYAFVRCTLVVFVFVIIISSLALLVWDDFGPTRVVLATSFGAFLHRIAPIQRFQILNYVSNLKITFF